MNKSRDGRGQSTDKQCCGLNFFSFFLDFILNLNSSAVMVKGYRQPSGKFTSRY
jgi:hypothetical protein